MGCVCHVILKKVWRRCLWQEDSDSTVGRRLPKTGDRWHAVSQYLKLHILLRLAVEKKVWNWSSSQIGSKIDIHQTSWNYDKHQRNTLCGDVYLLILAPFGFLTQPYFFKLTAPPLWVAPLSTPFVLQVRGLRWVMPSFLIWILKKLKVQGQAW